MAPYFLEHLAKAKEFVHRLVDIYVGSSIFKDSFSFLFYFSKITKEISAFTNSAHNGC